jgi:predicted CXXCH cytochrome family protein
MKNNIKSHLAFIIILFVASGIYHSAAADEGCITSKCHQTLLKDAKYSHGPTAAGDCSSCHTPHEPGKKSQLVKAGNELCFVCHYDIQEEMKKKVVHPALLSGCTSCHNPHGSSFRKLLSAQGDDLCFQCHPNIADRLKGQGSIHAPLKSEKGCASCHSPHASDNDRLLSRKGMELCLGCHKNVLRKNMTTLHGPIREGLCTPCHDPHGSPNAKLLLKEFPAAVYVPYTDKEYELCFSCHKRDMVRFPDTSFATGFRDGDRNLHYLHVNNKEKGRSCRICHDFHGNERPRLVAQSVTFGKWQLSLKFTKAEDGGSCSPGCHKTYSYNRKGAGKEPEQQKPAIKKETQK